MSCSVVVVGASGNVGREILNILDERSFPVSKIAAVASRKSLGKEISFGEQDLRIQDIETFDFTEWQIALFAIGSDATKTYAPKAAAKGCIVIDNTSHFRRDEDIPLVVPEVNPHAIAEYTLSLIHI